MNCRFCERQIDEFRNYCSWECGVNEAKQLGGKIITPNNLPIKCIKADGTMLEHEHGDHPDYKFPVKVEFIGVKPELPDWDTSFSDEPHALIYVDGCVALTMYECTYVLWSLSDGTSTKPSYKDWKLTNESIKKITDHHLNRQTLPWQYEVCKKCNRRNTVGFDVDDDIWQSVVKNRWNVLCASCFDEEAQAMEIEYSIKNLHPVTWSM